MKKLIALLSLLATATPALADGQLSLSAGFDYSTGKYGGTKSINILSIPFTATYETDKWTFKVTVPYISISGAGAGVLPGMVRTGPKSTNQTVTTTQSGLGDVILSAGYEFYSGDALTLDAVGKVKLGTADETKGLGTGMNDYSGQIDGYYVVSTTTFFATAGYKLVGSPVGLNLNNVAFGTLGISQKLDNTDSAGVMLDAAQSPSATGAGPKTVTAFLSHKISDSTKLQPYVLKGLSTGSPDFGFGAMITGKF